MNKKSYKNENGLISVFTMLAMFFFLFVIVGIYAISSKRAQTQTQSFELAKSKYYSEDVNEVYNSKLATNSEIIPIYTKEQLWSIGENVAIEIDGKIYEFSETNTSKYELKNDIVINIDTDDLKDVKITESNGYKVYYYKDNEYYEPASSDLYDIEINGYYFKKIKDKTANINYGTSIQSLYSELYAGVETGNLVTKTIDYDLYWTGNYKYPRSLENAISKYGTTCTKTTTNNNGYEYIKTGENNLEFTDKIDSQWFEIYVYMGYYTGGKALTLTNLKLLFDDGTCDTIENLVNNEYIEPLVVCSASQYESSSYLPKNVSNLLNGNNFITNWASPILYMKNKGKSSIIGLKMNSSGNFDTYYKRDGIKVIKYSEGVEISITSW